jgi:hypothetical protein
VVATSERSTPPRKGLGGELGLVVHPDEGRLAVLAGEPLEDLDGRICGERARDVGRERLVGELVDDV